MNKHLSLISGGVLLAAVTLFSQPVTATTFNVACPGQTIQAALDSATAGDTINVTGSCAENVVIRNEKLRIGIVGNGATISGPNSNIPTLNVRGKGIFIQGFTITGGRDGIQVNRGSNAVIQNNTITSAARNGILVDQLAFAVIVGNTIQNNPGAGIVVSENSIARIGFNLDTDSAETPNVIQSNGKGIVVSRTSSARIIGNQIVSNNGASNTGDGIQVIRVSQADIAKNLINSNSGHGISVAQNGGVQLGEDNPTTFFDDPNTTTSNNTLNGINCQLGATVNGHLGSSNQINGSAGQTNIDASCPSSLVAP